MEMSDKLTAAQWELEQAKARIAALEAELARLEAAGTSAFTAHPASEWKEADGAVLWWSDQASVPYAAEIIPFDCIHYRTDKRVWLHNQFAVLGDYKRVFPYWSRIPKVAFPAGGVK